MTDSVCELQEEEERRVDSGELEGGQAMIVVDSCGESVPGSGVCVTRWMGLGEDEDGGR